MALCVHYLYILGKIEKRQYPPRMTPQMRKDLMRFEHLREQFRFLRENDISTAGDMAFYEANVEEKLAKLMKQRTILNLRKRKRWKLYNALADVEMLRDVQRLQAKGVSGFKGEVDRYLKADAVLKKSGIDRETLKQEKAGLYDQLAEMNREILDVRKKRKVCVEIKEMVQKIEQEIQRVKLLRQKEWRREQTK